MRKPYPTDLSDAEWNYIKPYMPAPNGHGRPRTHDLREILNAVFYVLKSGCQWRLLPTTSLDGQLSITISELGVSTVLGKGSTGPYENALGFA
jgi:transposase